jgi:hypothetical protein
MADTKVLRDGMMTSEKTSSSLAKPRWRVGIDRSEVYGINRGGRGSEVGDVLLEGVAAARR